YSNTIWGRLPSRTSRLERGRRKIRGGHQSISTGLQKNLRYVRNTGSRTARAGCFFAARGEGRQERERVRKTETLRVCTRRSGEAGDCRTRTCTRTGARAKRAVLRHSPQPRSHGAPEPRSPGATSTQAFMPPLTL